ncbi:MAG: transcriptional regulator GutM [Chloroflexales bacterium]|nr:transcriptional regulator GutM [Chloroflexales bacterium]
MAYLFLVVAILWIAQFGMAYWQLRRFHGRIAELRAVGRTAVGMYGNRWRGRTYAVLTVDGEERIRRAELFDGWTVFSKLRPVAELEGRSLESVAEGDTPSGMRQGQWAALQHAASFLQTKPQAEAT